MNDSTQYIKDQLAAGVLPTQIVQNLVQAGWQEPQATAIVQQVSGVQLAVAAGPGGYTRPPIVLQILYALSFLALVAGIILLATAISIFSSTDSGLGSFVAGFQLVIAIYLLSVFWLFRKLRNGSLFALKIYTVLTVIGILVTAGVFVYLKDESTVNRALAPDSLADILSQNIFPVLLTLYLWTRHRAYFH